MNRIKKCFIICAAVFCIGTGMCLGGVFAGGISDIDKVAKNHDWLVGSPGKIQVAGGGEIDFDSVEATGNLDLVLLGSEYMKSPGDEYLPSELSEVISAEQPGEGTVLIACGKNVEVPKNYVDNGTLKIEGNPGDDGVLTINFSSDDVTPTVVVFCGDKSLKKIDASNNFCDFVIQGVSFEKAELWGSDNDIVMDGVRSGSLKIDGNCTDADLRGDFFGTTDIEIDDGDVEIETSVSREEYAMDIYAEDGDIEIADGEIEVDEKPWKYSCEGGPNKLNIRIARGDVELFFGDTLYR
ncbi:MAG: DUF4097 family beta strand repeat-containing protein [Bacillota bacterium]|nr:DUF4097 family beta strand repeat-containing protein [Bacillota bacterium]